MSTAADNRFYREKPAPTTITLTEAEVERFTTGIADVLQWFYGFHAALPDDTSKRMPADWQALIELNIKIRQAHQAASVPF